MSAAAAPARARARRPGGALLAGAAVLGLVAALWLLSRGERDLQEGATGFAGLVAWLEENGVDARIYRGERYLVEGEIGLRILPLYDVDLSADRTLPETAEALIAQTSEEDFPLYVVPDKAAVQPTLVVLPKWRSGVRVLGAAHRDLLIPDYDLTELVRQIPRLGGRIIRDRPGYAETALPEGRIGLFHRQALNGAGCEPVLGDRRRILIARCPVDMPDPDRPKRPQSFWALADPDLMNNHGLTLAANAEVALAFVRELAGGKPVIIDLTDEVMTFEEDWFADDGRSWEEFARLFEWPLGVVWIAFGALAGLALWRALVRYGPVEAPEEGEAMRASKEVSIDARARLLRLADHDAELMRLHIATRLHQLAAELLGPHRPVGPDSLALLAGMVGRRSPELARELSEAARPPETGRGRADDLLRRLDRFETVMDRVRDEFGRAAGAR